jgi:hypothetical protein
MKLISESIAKDCGKTRFTMQHIGHHRAPIVYAATREEVENLDLSRYLAAFGIYQKPWLLRRFRGRIYHVVDGYDDIDTPIFEVPEVRRFYTHICDIWPGWVYTASLLDSNLWALALCAVPNLYVRRTDNKCIVQVPEADLRSLVAAARPALTLLGLRAGLPSDATSNRISNLERCFSVGRTIL